MAYTSEGLLPFSGFTEKVDNETVAEAFRRRLRDAAGFRYVPVPLPMRNSKNAVVYYLFFASRKPVALRHSRADLHEVSRQNRLIRAYQVFH